MRLIIKKYEAILFCATLLVAVFAASDVRRSDISTGQAHATPAIPSAGAVALTFDDGPHPAFTAQLAAKLKKYGVPATFYLVGKQIEKHPSLAALLAENGFEIGGHTYSHDNLTLLDEARVIYELEKTRILIRRHASVDSRGFRPPGGRHDERIRRIAEGMGYRMVLWDVLPKDHEDISSRDIARRVLDGVKRNHGGIVLLHSGKASTIEALDDIIPTLLAEGFKFSAAGALSETNAQNTGD